MASSPPTCHLESSGTRHARFSGCYATADIGNQTAYRSDDLGTCDEDSNLSITQNSREQLFLTSQGTPDKSNED